MATTQYDFFVNLDDLAFILQQIKIAESTTTPDGGISGLAEAVGSPLLPYGLRTVDGTWNNLLPGQERLGAADNIMPRLLDPNYQMAEAVAAGFFGPGSPAMTTSYAQTAPGNIVVDSEPRVISNLIVDQTANNPAAVIAALNRAEISTYPGTDVVQVSDNGTLFIPNMSPDIGLSPPFNGVMTFFGQFFDHGLDLITKGGGTVFVPLKPDDPLYVEGSQTNFMVLSRAAVATDPGPDGVAGTSDDIVGHVNTTTPFVDQNQTYTSHPSHQVFLREYTMVDGKPLATGKLLTGAYGEGTWADVKAQAAEKLGVQLTDQDVFNVPLLATDRYGEFIRGANGFVQFVTTTGLLEANPGEDGRGMLVPENALRTNHEFLIDVAHSAVPGFVDLDHDPTTDPIAQVRDNDGMIGDDGNPLTYDGEMLDRHFATGDGRGNENIGLTAIHGIFHSEHNRLVDQYKSTILSSASGGDLAFLNEWLLQPITELPTTPEGLAALQWDGERLFQAGRFATEMQYQHLVFEEFARAVAPTIDPFVFSNSPDLNPAILEEFANVVYRFGHSMLTETVARTDSSTMSSYDIGLIQAFLNPPEFNAGGIDEAQAIADIVLGMSRQPGNEIDEFITEALRNNLVGLPLDLATLNMTRARETGVPTFNEARAEFFEMTGESQYKPYTSWADLAPHLKNPASIINFVAAYGTHQSIVSAETVADKRAAATVLVMGSFDINNDGDTLDAGERANAADRQSFLFGDAATTGVNDIDFWVGGLAEAKLEFGGMLGPTFNFVFESQLENLQNGDRFYYLSRTQGLNMLNELEANTFSKMIMRNSDLGSEGTTAHLPSLIFGTPSYVLEMDQSKQRTGILGPDGVTLNGDPERDDPFLNAFNPLVVRVAPGADVDGDGFADGGVLSYAYDGGDHVVLGGTRGNDILLGGRGMDTIWGDGGDDYIDGGDEADQIHGGDGDDIIVDHGTVAGGADFLRGDNGNDVISSGPGNDIVFGGDGKDFIFTGQDFTEVFAGRGNDFVLGGNGPDALMGNEGDDWIEGGEGFDSLSGENSQLFFNSTIIGHDVLNGNGNDTDYDGESGDDIMIQGPGIQRSNGMFGFDWASHKGDPVGADSDLGIPLFTAQPEFILRDRFDSVEGLSGWVHDDVLTGAALLRGGAGGAGDGVNVPADASNLKAGNIGLINGLAELIGMTDEQVNALPDDFSVIDILDGSEIIIGGGGSDTIKGNLGNDIIDGDAWLNTRIRVTANVDDANTAENEIATYDSMTSLRSSMLSREINPGQLHIVREILYSETRDTDVDTAVYNGSFEEYTVTSQDDGSVIVAHVAPVTVDDGTDTLRNIEQLQFLDRLIRLGLAISSNGGGATAAISMAENTTAVTTVTLSNSDPTQLYLFSLDGADAGLFEIDALVGTLSFITAPNFEAAGDIGLDNIYDVIVRVTDGVLSDSQAIAITVTNADDLATGGVQVASWTTTATAASLTAANTVADEDGMVAGPTYQWQRLNTTTGEWEDIAGATAATLAGRSSTTDRVVVKYTDSFGEHTVIGDETVIVGDGLANTLVGTAGRDIILGLGGDDTLTGGAGDDVLEGNGGNDTLLATAGDGNDILRGGAGIDTYSLAATVAGAIVDLTAGSSTSGATGSDVLAGIENIIGSQGADTITDGAGANVLTGGGGADTFIMTNDNARDTVDGGAGSNTVDYSAATNNLNVTLNPGAVVGGSGNSNATSDVITGIDNFIGGSGNDTITGNNNANRLQGGAGADVLNGLGGADTLIGNGGADTLNGGAGNDILDGGAGNDTFVASTGDGNDAIDGGGGIDHYNLSATTAAANVNLTTGTASSAAIGSDTLTDIENITGSQGGDTITDGAGSNVLTGGGGADTFIMTNDNARDTVDGAGGSNTVSYASATANLNVTLANGAVVGGSGTTAATSDVISNIDNFIGGSGNDTITGNNNGNRILGGGGNDVIAGGGGADVLMGEAGNDRILASGGNDLIDGGAGTDTYDLSATTAAATVNLTTGTSSSGQTGNDTLTGIENVIGSQGGDTITDGAGSNVLTGGGGADTFIMTNDNARDTIDGAGGNNTVDYSSATANLNVTLTNGAVVGGSGTTAATSDVISNIDNFTGGSGNDTITGNANANVLNGNGGADTLSGLGGNDTLNGGAGNDTLLGGDGNDTLNGNAGADTLNGGLGVDTLNGGAGADTFDFNSTAEIPVAPAGQRETVQDFASGTDKLDFNGIDANVGAGGNQDFTFSAVAGAPTTGTAQLRYDVAGGSSTVNGNTGGANGLAPDMQVSLVGVTQLQTADVIG